MYVLLGEMANTYLSNLYLVLCCVVMKVRQKTTKQGKGMKSDSGLFREEVFEEVT